MAARFVEADATEILARSRKAKPRKYAAAKKENTGNGAAYPDGFTINVMVRGEDGAPLTFPLLLQKVE